MQSTNLFVCLLTFVAVWNCLSSVAIKFTKYKSGSELAGYRCIPNETAFEVENISNFYECSKLCHLNNMCISFFYQTDIYKCIGCRVNLGIRPGSSYESYPGSLYFYTKTFSETSCKEISENNSSATSGLYKIRLLKSMNVTTVYCDMDTDGGGWTVFQNRFDGSVDFHRNFLEYENGFGALNGEFWLGLKIVQEMTYQGTTEFRLDVTTIDNETYTETCEIFYLDKGPYYTLHLTYGTYGPSQTLRFMYNNGQNFSTYDFDQDGSTDVNCASYQHGGWWFNYCTEINLNVPYNNMVYNYGTLKTTKMMFR